MKRMTDSEKIVVIARAINNAFSTQDIAAIIDCPYGDATHVGVAPLVPERCCATCSKLDGSECIDDLIRIYDRERWPNGKRLTSDERDAALNYAVDAVREWRAKR